jgi:hypothetical protein
MNLLILKHAPIMSIRKIWLFANYSKLFFRYNLLFYKFVYKLKSYYDNKRYLVRVNQNQMIFWLQFMVDWQKLVKSSLNWWWHWTLMSQIWNISCKGRGMLWTIGNTIIWFLKENLSCWLPINQKELNKSAR